MDSSSEETDRSRNVLGLEDLDPAILNFLAGVCATLFTSFALFPPLKEQVSPFAKFAEVGLWLFASVALAFAGAVLENAKHQADMSITPHLSERERRSLYSVKIKQVRVRLSLLMILGLLFMAFGIIIQV